MSQPAGTWRLAVPFCMLVALVPPAMAAGSGALPGGIQSAATVSIPGTLVKFDLVHIPAGTLIAVGTSGSKLPVKVGSFWIGKTEVTWDEYDVYAFRLDLTEAQQTSGADATSRPSRPYGAPDRGFGHHGYPALAMTIHASEEYCRWLSAKTGARYRLPTEAEWEYAGRAGAPAGMKPDNLNTSAWFWENADDKTHPAGAKTPNAWGLVDMLGNVAEWCRGADGTPVVRGGSYNDRAARIGWAARAVQTPAWNATDPQNPKSQWWLANAPFVGFRIVREETGDSAVKSQPR